MMIVYFLQAINANIKLNTKKLYQADGYAVHELLKIAKMLYDAQKNSFDESRQMLNDKSIKKVDKIDITKRIDELKYTRQLASMLTVNGASLFDLLGREVQLREIRNSKINRQFDTSEIELALKDVISNTKKEIEDTKIQIDNVKETEQNLEIRIERRRIELERNNKRLQTLRKVRPAFMEEFEKLEVELRIIYDDYLQKNRYLGYLEHLYEDAAKAEQERFERRQAATKRQLEKLRGEDASFESMMEGNDSIFINDIHGPLEEAEKRAMETPNQSTIRPSETAERTSRMQITQRKIYGSMSGRQRGGLQKESHGDSIGSLDSDSDLLIDGDLEDDDDDEDDDEDDDLEDNRIINPVAGHEIASYDLKSNNEKRAASKMSRSDEDF